MQQPANTQGAQNADYVPQAVADAWDAVMAMDARTIELARNAGLLDRRVYEAWQAQNDGSGVES